MPLKLDTELLEDPEKTAKFMIELNYDDENGLKAKFDIDGNGGLLHEMVKALMLQRADIREIFEDVFDELNND
ncbi:hypothetical protein [Chishuiella changwenlii]|uniref:hypothetical protein n=1 Tax=Chishuiella changwenlii TaxID=1434701 RepID=UPI002FDADB7A